MAPVVEAAARAHALGADLYLRSATGMALIAPFLDPRFLTAEVYGELGATAAAAGAAIVDAAQLPERARRRFHDEYLPLYDITRGGLAGLADALLALAELSKSQGEDASRTRVEVKFRRGD